MSDFESKITGEQALLKNLSRLGQGLLLETQAAGLGVGEELILDPARARAPMKTGRTRRSGVVTVRKYAGATIVKVTFGGQLAPWAPFIHENLQANYKNGEPKFLERTFLAARGNLTREFAKRISLARAVRG